MDESTEAPALTKPRKIILEFFPHEYLVLDKELRSGFHPKLEAILARFPPEEIDMKLAQTSAYCQVVLDADYTLDHRRKLCLILAEKLMDMREMPAPQVILPLTDGE
jgi:hypothetical protein